MTHVSLFSGIGGLDLAAEWAGFETVLQVERDPYCLRVLEKHWPDVPRITDIREVHDDDRWREPTIVSGGFPCQKFSTAARGRNNAEDLWPEMLRVIREIEPRWVVAENVQRRPIERAARQLLDYHCTILDLPAACVGAADYRPRWFLVAYSDSYGKSPCSIHEEVAHILDVSDMDGWKEPSAGLGMDAGLSYGMAECRMLGNSVKPQQAYPILAAIASAETMRREA